MDFVKEGEMTQVVGETEAQVACLAEERTQDNIDGSSLL